MIERVCSDESPHSALLKKRRRNITGWHELEWPEVEKVRQYCVPREEERLVLNMVNPFEENLLKAEEYCG